MTGLRELRRAAMGHVAGKRRRGVAGAGQDEGWGLAFGGDGSPRGRYGRKIGGLMRGSIGAGRTLPAAAGSHAAFSAYPDLSNAKRMHPYQCRLVASDSTLPDMQYVCNSIPFMRAVVVYLGRIWENRARMG